MAAKDLIMIYHIPVKGMSRNHAVEQINEFFNAYEDKRYFKQYFLPHYDDSRKFDIECINIEGSKKTLHSKKIDLETEDIIKIMDYIIKQNRINKINRINGILNEEV